MVALGLVGKEGVQLSIGVLFWGDSVYYGMHLVCI